MLIWQGRLYLAAPLYSLLRIQRESAPGVPLPVADQGKPVLEQLAARWVVAFSMVLIGAFGPIRFLPSPTPLPVYARFLPADSSSITDLSPDQAIGGEPAATSEPTSSAPALDGTTATATITVESANCSDKPKGNADRVTYLYKSQELEIVEKTMIQSTHGGT